jgi:hypothetical protein
MCPTANGSGRELEKSLDAPPPSIAITAPEDVPDAGLRSLDHCRYSSGIHSISADIIVLKTSFKVLFCWHDKCDYSFRSRFKTLPTDRPLNLEILALFIQSCPTLSAMQFPMLRIYIRQTQASTMAIQAATETFTPDKMGDPVPCLDAG